MALIPDSKEMKEEAHLARMTAWLAKMSVDDRKKYCDHGNSKIIAFYTCKYCKEETNGKASGNNL